MTSYRIPETDKGYTLKTRKAFISAIKSFLDFHIGEVTDYDFSLETSDEQVAEIKRKEEDTGISVDEYKKLVLSATTLRDKAILLTIANGLGTAEWIQFSGEWHKYAEQIRKHQVPIRVNVIRPKTKTPYFVEFWDDAVDHLALLLEQREREMGRTIGKGDSLFVNTVGGAITNHRVQRMVRNLADSTGLDKREKGRVIYRIRPHEIGRDFFRTLCEQAEVPATIAEFSLGHKIDKLEYNKFYNQEEGKTRVQNSLEKVRPLLNVVSGKGLVVEAQTSYFDEATRFLSAVKGIDLEKIQERLVHEVFRNFPTLYDEKTRQLAKEHKPSKELKMADVMATPSLAYGVFHKFSRDELFPAVFSLAKSLSEPTTKKPEQKVVDANEVQAWLDKGWSFRSSINGHFALMERESQ